MVALEDMAAAFDTKTKTEMQDIQTQLKATQARAEAVRKLFMQINCVVCLPLGYSYGISGVG